MQLSENWTFVLELNSCASEVATANKAKLLIVREATRLAQHGRQIACTTLELYTPLLESGLAKVA